MKLYLLVNSSRNDGGEEFIDIEPFETEKEVRKAFQSAIDDDKDNVEALGWETEVSENSYESFNPGYEMEDHVIISIREVEVKGNHKVRTVCGEDLTCELDENDGRKLTIRKARRRCPSIGNLCQRTFDTRAEVDAYRKGQMDQDSWQETEDGEDRPEITDEVWEKFGKTDEI